MKNKTWTGKYRNRTGRSGKTLAEYGLLLALLVLVAVPGISFLGQAINNSFAANEPVSQAGELFALLDANGGGGMSVNTASTVPTSAFSGLSSEGQPVDNVYFSYNEKTGMLEVVVPDGSATGTSATSADGTRVLAQNIQDMVDEMGDQLSDTEKQQLNQLSQLAFKLAQAEKDLLAKYPSLANGPDPNAKIFGFFETDWSGRMYRVKAPQPDVWGAYRDFSKAYETLTQSLPESDPRLTEIRKTIDTNATLVSQLAYKNFIEPQTSFGGNGYKQIRNMSTEDLLAIEDIDIKKLQIKPKETPAETEKAGKNIETAENDAEKILNTGETTSAQ